MQNKIFLKSFFIALIFLVNCTAFSELRKREIISGPDFLPYDGLKTTIAVMEFTNSSIDGGEKLGSAVADMLVTLLMRSGRFIVLERELVQEILQEQALGQSGAVTEETAPEVGKLLGAQTLITGTIVEASQKTGSHVFKGDEEDEEDEKNDFWGLALKTTIGHIEINFRMIDTMSGNINLSDHVSATEVRPGIDFKTKDYEIEDTFEFDQTILGLATRKALNSIIRNIVGIAGDLEWQGKVVEVKQDSLVYFTPGRNSGVVIGDWFEVLGSRNFTNAYGDTLSESYRKGSLEIIDFVGERVSKTIVIDGGFIEIGDIILPLKPGTN